MKMGYHTFLLGIWTAISKHPRRQPAEDRQGIWDPGEFASQIAKW